MINTEYSCNNFIFFEIGGMFDEMRNSRGRTWNAPVGRNSHKAQAHG